MSEQPWSIAEDPDEDVDWSVDFDDEPVATADEASDTPKKTAPLVVFVHIQKTAGKTLRNILRRQYAGPGRSVHVPNFFAKPDLHWSTVDELFERLPPGLEVAHGHMLFVPDRWPSEARFVTILRDPVERTISHYYWLNERRGARPELGSIDEAIEQGAVRDNLQVRVLAGADPPEPVTSTMAEEAIAALDRFTAVGLTSRFDETLVLFGRAFGWRTAAYERVNSTNSRVPREALDAATLERIQEHNRYDHELYAVAAERFDELMRAQPDDFQTEVDIVRAAAARAPLDAPWPTQSIVLSTEGIDARALLVSSEAARLAAELDRQRLRAANRRIGVLTSERRTRARTRGGYTDHSKDEALRVALDRIDELESAQRGARKKIAKARKRLANPPEPVAMPPGSSVGAPDATVEHATAVAPAKKKAKQPRDPNIARKSKRPRDATVERTSKVPRPERPNATPSNSTGS